MALKKVVLPSGKICRILIFSPGIFDHLKMCLRQNMLEEEMIEISV